ncbi:hypothetical protein [Alteromonas facilis]|uniref:hypothetical protein n=1 Tax=Alteromonas facilis TaxID=2048004 RepID=UPI000C288810|nr:hypothetical protein [Alteromonas facilis]
MRIVMTAISVAFVSSLSGCASKDICEDILEVQRQEAVCQDLAKTMRDNKHPQQALTARKRYETECTDLRYYRDGYDTICKGDQKPIGARKEN